MRKLIILIVTLGALLTPVAVPAVQPDEVLADPVLEQRARAISGNLRCLVCQNQSIDDSDAQLARDLRLIVRERLTSGDSDTEVYDFVVARYGEFVLLNPVFAGHTIFLWVATPILLVASFIMLAVLAAKRRNIRTGAPSLSSEETKILEQLRSD
jgi:cytochrome c-type biogenesis protein CcmH|tara:strand:- start:642 stop:1106 length:465 start_codon:yes stop_codon:yes gene_type:complete